MAQSIVTFDPEKTIQVVLDKIKAKSGQITDYNKVIQFDFTDAKVVYNIKIVNGATAKVEKTSVRLPADVTVACKVEVLQNNP